NFRAHDRNENENSEKAIDHARHSGEQVDQKSEVIGEAARGQFGEKYCCTQAQRNSDQQAERRSNQRAKNEGQCPEMIKYRIPGRGPKKSQSEMVPGLS